MFLTGWMISTQKFAHMMQDDISIIGKPMGLFFGKPVFNPIYYLLCFPKYIFHPVIHPYLIASAGAFGWCAAIALITAILWGVLLGIYSNVKNLHGTARFATKFDLWKNGLLHKSGVICGELANAIVVADRSSDTALHLKLIMASRLICHTGQANTLLVAQTGDAKGVSFILPTLWSYTGSVIVYDPKGENYKLTAAWRKKFSHVIKFSPCSRTTIRFNPLMAIRDGDEYAYRDANLIADILFSPSKGAQNDTEQYFAQSAKDMATTAILHVRFCDECTDKSLAGVLHLLSHTDYRTLGKFDVQPKSQGEEGNADLGNTQFTNMKKAHHYFRLYDKKKKIYEKIEAKDLHTKICDGADRLLNTNPKEKASVFKTVFSKLQTFEDPILAEATSGSDFEIEDFINSPEPISLYLTVPYSDVARISLVFRMLISFMLKKFSEGETSYGAVKLKNHLLFLLDEFPTLGCFPDIAENMGVLRGYGVNFFIVCQSLKQLYDVYGTNHPFLDHCAVKIICAPNSVSDAKEFCEAIGQESINRQKVSRSGKRFTPSNSLNINDDDMARNLLDPSDLMRLPCDKCLIIAHTMQPYIAEKVVYYQDRRFKYKMSEDYPKSIKELYGEIAGLPSRERIKQEKIDEALLQKREPTEEKGKDETEICSTDEDEELINAVLEAAAQGKIVGEISDDSPSEFAAADNSFHSIW